MKKGFRIIKFKKNKPIFQIRDISKSFDGRPILKKISIQENSKLESLEKIEAIRFIEMGYRVKMVMTDKPSIGIDTKDDLKKANEIIKAI